MAAWRLNSMSVVSEVVIQTLPHATTKVLFRGFRQASDALLTVAVLGQLRYSAHLAGRRW